MLLAGSTVQNIKLPLKHYALILLLAQANKFHWSTCSLSQKIIVNRLFDSDLEKENTAQIHAHETK